MKKCLLFCIFFFYSYLFSTETTLLLIRHGETNWNREDRLQGYSDIPLNDLGHLQAQFLAKKMVQQHPNIAAIYSSDLTRAYETACETAKKLLIEKITVSPLLRERNGGEAEGLTTKEIMIRYGEEIRRINETYTDRKQNWNYSAVPGSEMFNSLLKRTKEELEVIIQEHPGEKVAIFTHGRLIKTLISDCLDSKELEKIPNCGVATFIYSDEGPLPSLRFIKIEDMLSESFE